LYLTKRAKTISNTSYRDAYNDFIDIYPQYSPSGIADYVSIHWDEIK
jgi:hypothetical protein